jgi:hypothetical protein
LKLNLYLNALIFIVTNFAHAKGCSKNNNVFVELKQEVTALTGEEKKLLLKKVDVDQTFKTINEKLNECKATIHQWHAKVLHQLA